MSVTSLDKDLDHLTLTLVADFAAPAERVWRLWSDPRQLERWWGPPSYPATVEEHDLTPGGDVTYFMTGPQGEKYRGWWRVATVDAPRSLEFTDGFADEDGVPNAAMPTTANRVTLTERDGGTRMELRSVFDTKEQMDQLMTMGMDEGMREAAGQMDALLAAD
ncbi:SRPBCC domain-containing protein [Streptomyces sp. NPDC048187]|uniref:SRPBCC family protein n=1 Tax=Streptomyces sp. NPDC048187 TaxID=3365509 RepID=UPI0037233C9E